MREIENTHARSGTALERVVPFISTNGCAVVTTPTVIVNGWRVDAPLDAPRLAELLRAYRDRS